MEEAPPAARRGAAYPVGVALALAILVGALTWDIGWPIVVIIGGPGTVAYVTWLLTTYRQPMRGLRITLIYLGLIVFQLVHMSEEYATDFPGAFTHTFHLDPLSVHEFAYIFVFFGVALWITGGILLAVGNHVGNFMLVFITMLLTLTNFVAHVVLAIRAGGYFPGLATAPGLLVFSAVLAREIVVHIRKSRKGGLQARSPTATDPSA